MSISPPPRSRKRRKIEVDRPQKGNLTIYSWNVNGIDPLLQSSLQHYWSITPHASTSHKVPQSPIRQFLRRHQWPTLCFLQEIKVRDGDETKLKAIRKAVSNENDEVDTPGYEAHFCLSQLPRHNKRNGHRFYGVCTLVRKDFMQHSVEQVRTVGWDREGRILIVETKKTDVMPRLALINVYLVNGTSMPYRRPEDDQIHGTRHDRKLAVHMLLQTECVNLESRGYSIILAGDINIARSTLDGFPKLRITPHQHVLNREDFEKRFLCDQPLKMYDTFRHLHPRKRGYSYYTRATEFGRSCDRVDMVIVSSSIISGCIAAGMHETMLERGSSDHVPVFAEFAFAVGQDEQLLQSTVKAIED